ncbi:MAG: nuclear transport factor 2 family protein [Acidimicrobiales bacterium]
MSITEQDLQQLIAALDQGRARWIDGRGEFAADSPIRQADDMTIFGPFGGPGPAPGSVTPEQMSAGQAAISAQFQGGDGNCEVVHTIVEGDLAIVAMIERSAVKFQARDGRRPWVLRTTQVFRKTPDGWLRLHRHADPLIGPRSLAATVALFDGA